MRRLYAIWPICVLMLIPSAAWAQATITGVARDTSGAVLPGVTVEATSPALIERAVRRHGQHGPVSHRRAQARHLYRHVHTARLFDRQA